METIYEKYMALPIDKGSLCLEYGDIADPYFCYPVNANPIGFEGCILYCFLPEYGEMVFACNPESCVDQNVYPLAANFEDFIRLILACGTANPLEQIVWMDKNKFEEHMANEEKILTDEQRTALLLLLLRRKGNALLQSPYPAPAPWSRDMCLWHPVPPYR